ncbi:MAG TPA: SBBP repeat-containing protein [bacterium]|nr:SBBP repeat-containing protein [bacterium]
MKRLMIGAGITALLLLGLVSKNGPVPGIADEVRNTSPDPLVSDWVRTWGGSSAKDQAQVNKMAADKQGNLYVAGNFSGTVDFNPDPAAFDWRASEAGSIDAFLCKFDPKGKLLWTRTWGGNKRDTAYGVDVDRFGNAYVVGPFRSTVDFDPDPVKTAIQTSNATGGQVYENNVFLSKFAPDGSFQWVRTWGPKIVPGKSAFGAEGYNVAVAGDCLYVAGDFSGDRVDFNPWGGHDWHANHVPATGLVFFDVFLSKFDLDGTFQWARTWGGEGYDDGPGVAVDGEGNVYVAGMYASREINFDPAGGKAGLGYPAQDSGIQVDVFLSKFDAAGRFKWVRTWGSKGSEEAMGSVCVDRMKNVYVCGRFTSNNCDFNPRGKPDIHSTQGGQDLFLSKFDSEGNFQWARTWGGRGDDQGGVTIDRAGNPYAWGWFCDTVDFDPGNGTDRRVSNGKQDLFFSRFDPNGSFNWVQTLGGPDKETGSVMLDDSGNLYAGGSFAGTVDFDPGRGIDSRTASGARAAFLGKFLLRQ